MTTDDPQNSADDHKNANVDPDNLADDQQQPDALSGTAELERRFGIKPADWGRQISPRDVQWLLDHCPFIQIVAGGGASTLEQVNVTTAPSSNWPICDYGDAMSSSPGPYILGGGYFRVRFDDDEDEGGSGSVNPGKGTIINQAFLTCADLVQMAQDAGWTSIHMVDGHHLMGRALWIHATRSGITVTGFEPDENDLRIQRLLDVGYDELQIKRSFISHDSGSSDSGSSAPTA